MAILFVVISTIIGAFIEGWSGALIGFLGALVVLSIVSPRFRQGAASGDLGDLFEAIGDSHGGDHHDGGHGGDHGGGEGHCGGGH